MIAFYDYIIEISQCNGESPFNTFFMLFYFVTYVYSGSERERE